MEISVWNLALFVAYPGNWLKHALGGDILVPRKARASTKKLYVIMSFCTRTYRTLIFPFGFKQYNICPYKSFPVKTARKNTNPSRFSCTNLLMFWWNPWWNRMINWFTMEYNEIWCNDGVWHFVWNIFCAVPQLLLSRKGIYIYIYARFMHISIPTCTKVNMRTFAFHSIWVWSLRVNINDNLGGGFK